MNNNCLRQEKVLSASVLPKLSGVVVFIYNRVESGLDDPDNLGHLGHFFGGSSGSYLQTRLFGCDRDITCSLENSIGIW